LIRRFFIPDGLLEYTYPEEVILPEVDIVVADIFPVKAADLSSAKVKTGVRVFCVEPVVECGAT
jgi:hypothetical protein